MKKVFLVSEILLFMFICSFLIVSKAPATTIDLTTIGSTGMINGAIFSSPPTEVAGTGYIDSFVRIQRTGTEQGYNADVLKQADFQYDEKYGIFTHSLLLNDIQSNIVEVNGVDYYEFVLDINESLPNALLSMNELEIYLSNTGSRNPPTGLDHPTAMGSLIYDLDGLEDSVVELNYSLFPGSGKLDMFALIPTSLFGIDLTKNVVLYSAFGAPEASDNGFEEWAHAYSGTFTGGDPTPIPEPSTILFLLIGLLGVGIYNKKKN